MTKYLFKVDEHWCSYYTIEADNLEQAKELLQVDMENDPYPSSCEGSETHLIKEDGKDVDIVIE